MTTDLAVATDQGLLPVVKAGSLLATVPPISFLVDALLVACAVGIIGGTPKSYKTWLALELAIAVATGRPCLGRFAVGQTGPVLVYLAEDALPVVRERLIALCEARCVSMETIDIHVITAPSLRIDVDSDRTKLIQTIAHYRPRLLILDPFVRLHRIDENQAQEVAPLLDYLRQLQRTFEVSVLVVHHMRKSGSSGQSGQALRGSGDFHAWLDSGLFLCHERGQLKLTIEHRSAPTPEPFYLELAPSPLHLNIVGDKAPTEPPSLDEQILDTLAKASQPWTKSALRETLKVNNARLGAALKQLELSGKVKHGENGYQR